MKASARPVARSADISTSTIAVAHIRALTTAPRIKPTSIFLRSARRPNPGRGSTYRRGIFVQTTGTSSETPRSNSVLAVGQARMLLEAGWRVHIADATGRQFGPPAFNELLPFDRKP